jgi:hypothetical protein
MERNAGAAARLSQIDRAELAIVALARSEPISDLAVQHGVSRKFVYQQTHKARVGLDNAFSSTSSEHEVLFELGRGSEPASSELYSRVETTDLCGPDCDWKGWLFYAGSDRLPRIKLAGAGDLLGPAE